MSATRGLALGPVERGSFRPVGVERGGFVRRDMAGFRAEPDPREAGRAAAHLIWGRPRRFAESRAGS